MQSKILIADDEQTFALTTAALLQNCGHNCKTAFDSDEARELLRADDFDLVIADIKMPGNANLEWIRELSEANTRIPVILSTGYPSVETAVASLNLFVIEYLIKPFEFSTLENAIQKALRSRSFLNQLASTQEVMAQEIAHVDHLLTHNPTLNRVSAKHYQEIVHYQLAKIQTALRDLAVLSKATQFQAAQAEPNGMCHMLDCPAHNQLVEVIRDAIDVLEQTKSSFKSRQLAELRRKLIQSIGLH